MLCIQCPYCGEDNEIIAGYEITNLLSKGKSDCKCDYCKKEFEIYQGKEKYESRIKTIGGLDMKIILEEKDERYQKNINESIEKDEYVPLFVNNVGGEYYINFTCTDIAKANNFIISLLSPSNQDYIEETLGIRVNSLNCCHGDNKIQTLRHYLDAFLKSLDSIH